MCCYVFSGNRANGSSASTGTGFSLKMNLLIENFRLINSLFYSVKRISLLSDIPFSLNASTW